MFKTLLSNVSNDWIVFWFNTMFNILIKASIVLAIPLIINIIFKKSSAEFRHLLLFISILMLIILPFLPEPIFVFEFPMFQQDWNHQENELLRTDTTVSNSILNVIYSKIVTTENSKASMNLSTNNSPGISYYLAIFTFLTWFTGSCYLITKLLTGILGVYRIKKAMTPFGDKEWKKTLKKLSWNLKLNSPIQLFSGEKFETPFTFGIISPFIFLPQSSINWSVERRNCVLIHELSHIKRGDTLTHLIARFVIALFWLNPLAWVALRLLRLQQEEACDDRVLNYGIKPCEYASHLLDFLKEKHSAHPVAALGVSSFKTIKSRIGQILNPIKRRSCINIKMFIAAITIVAFLIVAVIMFGPTTTATEGSISVVNSKQSDIPSILPINGNIIACFGKRYHEKYKEERMHSGVDIEAKMGTPVRAAANGTVLNAEFSGGYGLMVIIAHQDEISTVYAHLNETLVKPGQSILQGDILGYSGNTGLTTGPHLHYEVRIKGQPVNPLNFVNQNNTPASSENGSAISQPQENQTASYPKFMKPVPISKINSPFGRRIDPITKESHFHSGIDIPLPTGTPVKASADGQVIKAELSGGYGILIIIVHQNNFSTYYAKLSHALVKAGDQVKQGDIIAYSGNTGRSTGPHLHFEVRDQDRPVNPILFFDN